ncbi:PRC-barrel domain protein precursor (fragment) [Bradyrhizobium sp. ORS 375]
MADSANLAVRFVAVKPADVLSSKLIGAGVYNNQNESLGSIEDLIIENGRAVSGVVVNVGGFLGFGESYVVLDPSTVVLTRKDGDWKAFVNTAKDTPKFSYSKTHK